MSPAQRLYALLKEAFPGDTDRQIGARVGVTKGAVSAWKNGDGDLRRKTLEPAAAVLGMTPGALYDKLYGEEGPPTPPGGVQYNPKFPPP